MTLLFALLLAHLTADFLQPAALVRWTKRSSYGLLVHVASYALLTGVVLAGQGPYWWAYLVGLSVTHFVLDHAKYLLAARFPREGVYLFIADQVLHVAVMVIVVFGMGLDKAPPSFFLQSIAGKAWLLPVLTGYVAASFAASILVFEVGRAFADKPDTNPDDGVATPADRIMGILERALAVSFILLRLWYLVPFAFAPSAYRLAADWRTKSRTRLIAEFGTSAATAIVIGVALLLWVL